jgi:hypothetical protein
LTNKAERLSFEVPTVSLHVHERIDPRTIVEAVRKRNGQPDQQMSLFQSPEENPPLREAIEFYKHPHNWSNRLIAGDSLLVMNSLLRLEEQPSHPPVGRITFKKSRTSQRKKGCQRGCTITKAATGHTLRI